MVEYIKREDAINLLWLYADESCASVVSDFESLPAVPVVRCRECKRWDTDADSYGKDDGPKGTCMKFFEDTYSDDYCSYGQRKEADHDVSKNH